MRLNGKVLFYFKLLKTLFSDRKTQVAGKEDLFKKVQRAHDMQRGGETQVGSVCYLSHETAWDQVTLLTLGTIECGCTVILEKS